MQNKTRQRKLICVAAIVALFFVMLIHRPFVAAAAKESSVQVANLGEVDLGGSITRFVLTSFRGPLICGLWWEARNAQAKHEYEQMELVIKALTKLQPHYRGPWKYEAWNLAYNVSVEFDSVADKYFYVTRGIRWLVEGERINRANLYDPYSKQMLQVGDPTMREEVGGYTQDKFSFADEAELYRIFLQLSCIPPERRDLSQLKNNPKALKEFKDAYPRLVRRIRAFRFVPEGAEKTLNDEILAFMERNQELPGLFPTASEAAKGLTKPTNEFPFWPEDPASGQARPANPGLEANQDCFDLARRWYEFAIEPLQATPYEMQTHKPKRSLALAREVTNKNSIIFRANPARTKSQQAMLEQKEGWCQLAQDTWRQAFAAWKAFGLQNGLELSGEEEKTLPAKAELYMRRFPHLLNEGIPPPSYIADEDRALYQRLSDSHDAFMRLKTLTRLRSTANYGYWRVASEHQQTDEHREARQGWYDAARRRSDLTESVALYDVAMRHWRRLLTKRDPLPPDMELGQRVAVFLMPGIPASLALQPIVLGSISPYGAHTQVQETLFELNDEYLKAYSIARAPALLKATLAASETAALLCRQAGSPGGQFGMGASLPLGVTALRIEDIEDLLQETPGPFAPFVSTGVREIKVGRDRMIRQQKLEGTFDSKKPAGGQPAGSQPSGGVQVAPGSTGVLPPKF